MYDLFSPTFKSNPFAAFAEMRENAPIYPHSAPDGTTMWYITRYEDVTAVLKDDYHFCKDPHNAKPPEAFSKTSRKSHVGRLINENMLFADAPAHTRLRTLVNQAFTPRRIAAMEPRIQAITDQLLDRVADQGAMDLIADYALPMPVAVICELLGIPVADQAQVTEWSQAIIAPGRHRLNYSTRRKRVQAFIAYLQAMFVKRRLNPQDDLITALVQAEEAGDTLSEAELSSMIALLLVTGHETTVNLIGNGTLALLEHPEELAKVKKSGRWETAVEELLRYDGPVETSTTRWARQDINFKGCAIKRGDVVRVVLSSANRDSCPFSEPDTLTIDRQDNQHLAFGKGIHYCLGAPLARLEGRIALETLFRRFEGLRLKRPSAKLKWRSGVLFRGLETLPIIWKSA